MSITFRQTTDPRGINKGDDLTGAEYDGTLISLLDGKYDSVLDYGAVGDGITDDTQAIQDALDTQKPIFVPAGKYRITSELVKSWGSKLIGETSTDRPDQLRSPESWIWYDGDIPTAVNIDSISLPSGSAVTVTTSTAHGFQEGQGVLFAGVGGTTELNNSVNGSLYSAVNVTSTTFELRGTDSDNFTAFTSGGTVRRLTTVIRCSTAIVGREAGDGSPSFSDNIQDCGDSHIVIDGNSKADFGIFGARCGPTSVWDSVHVRACLQHGIWMNSLFNAKLTNVTVAENLGCGMTLGRNDFNWSDSVINACHLTVINGKANGKDETFNEDTKFDWGYGVGLYLSRGNKIDAITCELNYGAGLFISSASGSNLIDSYYNEFNSFGAIDNGDATENWGLWVDSTTSNINMHIDSVYNQGSPSDGTGRYGSWKFTGTSSAIREQAIVIKNVFGGYKIDSEFDGYRLEFCTSNISSFITGNLPYFNDYDSITPDTPITTLYVRSDGSNSNDGRSASTAFSSLAKAIEFAKIITTVTTIDCSGVSLTDNALDFYGLKRRITINGGGTATISQVGSNSVALYIKNASTKVVFSDFSSIGRVRCDDSIVTFSSCSISPTGSSTSVAGFLCYGSNVVLSSSNIDVQNMTGATKIGVSIADGGKLQLQSSAVQNATSNRSINFFGGGGQVYTGSTDAWTQDITFQGNTGAVFNTTEIVMPSATIT